MVYGVLIRDWYKCVGNHLYGPFNTTDAAVLFIGKKLESYKRFLQGPNVFQIQSQKDDQGKYYVTARINGEIYTCAEWEIMEFPCKVSAMESSIY